MSPLQVHGKIGNKKIPITAPELYHSSAPSGLLCSHKIEHRVPCVSAIHVNIQPHPVLPLQVRNCEIDSEAEPVYCGQSVLAEPWQFVRNIKKSIVYLPNSSTWQPPGVQ